MQACGTGCAWELSTVDCICKVVRLHREITKSGADVQSNCADFVIYRVDKHPPQTDLLASCWNT